MKLRLDFDPDALRALEAQLAWLNERSPRAAQRLRAELFDVLDLVTDGLLDGMRVTLPTGEVTRRLVVQHLLVFYAREPEAVRVVFIHDARQRPFDR